MSTQEIKSPQNEFVKHLVKLRTSKKYRYEQRAVLLEGEKIIREVCHEKIAKTLILDQNKALPKNIKEEKVIKVPTNIIKKISAVKSPEGFIAEIAMPEQADLSGKKFILCLDKIRDPGNMGTLIRTALALGWEGVFITKESVDPFNSKALQAARGSTFSLPIYIGSFLELKKLIEKNRLKPLVADTNGKPPENFASKKGPMLLILSNEAHGLSKETMSWERVSIPMPGEVESLNVAIAGAILMHTLKK